MMAENKPEETTTATTTTTTPPSAAPAVPETPTTAPQVEETVVFVSNISPTATNKTVSDFFSFCGEIKSLVLRKTATVADGTQEAIVTFESAAAAKTAQLLTNALIVDRAITVRAYNPQKDALPSDAAATIGKSELSQRSYGDVPDSQRSKTSVVASMIASGYVLGEEARQAAIEYDEKHKITATMKERAHAIDAQLGITEKVTQATTFVNGKVQKIDQQLGLSQAMHTVVDKVAEGATVAKVEAERIASRAAENPFVNSCFSAIRMAGTSITNTYEALRNESIVAIDEKHKERSEQQPMLTPITPPSTTTPQENQQTAQTTTTTTTQPNVVAPIYPVVEQQPQQQTEAPAEKK